jgi:hypothetical protein
MEQTEKRHPANDALAYLMNLIALAFSFSRGIRRQDVIEYRFRRFSGSAIPWPHRRPDSSNR